MARKEASRVVPRELTEAAPVGKAGIVDDLVETAERGERLLDRRGADPRLGEVAEDGCDARALLAASPCDRTEPRASRFVLPAAVQHERGIG